MAKLNWKSMECAPTDQRILLKFGDVICSGRKRYGNLGEPSQDTFDWRADCCGCFANPQGWDWINK